MIESIREDGSWNYFQRWSCDACDATMIVIFAPPAGWYHAVISPDWSRVYCPACVKKAAGRILGLIDG